MLQRPWSRDGFIQLIEAVEDIQDEAHTVTEPLVIHCTNGATKSGLYCACAVVCELIREEEECDVFHTIKHLKRRRPQFINNYVSSVKPLITGVYDLLASCEFCVSLYQTPRRPQFINSYVSSN